MAKQSGIIKIEGTIGDITFLKTKDGYLVKSKGGVSADRMANDPAFQRTRENNAEFGRAGKATKALRNAFRIPLQNASDKRMSSRLLREFMRVIHADATSERGQRNVIDGESELLKGFDFNIDGKLSSTFYGMYEPMIDRVSGELFVHIPSFIGAQLVAAPAGTTHFRFHAGAAAVDFTNESYEVQNTSSTIFPWDNSTIAGFSLNHALTPATTVPLFLALGIEFMQLVNGTYYPLKNGAFNALSLVAIDGG